MPFLNYKWVELRVLFGHIGCLHTMVFWALGVTNLISKVVSDSHFVMKSNVMLIENSL